MSKTSEATHGTTGLKISNYVNTNITYITQFLNKAGFKIP